MSRKSNEISRDETHKHKASLVIYRLKLTYTFFSKIFRHHEIIIILQENLMQCVSNQYAGFATFGSHLHVIHS